MSAPGIFRGAFNYEGDVLATSNAPMYPGLNVFTTATGVDWKAGAYTATNNLSIPDDVAYNQFRLVAAGFEVVNTTSALNKQGSVTSYRSPNSRTEGYLSNFSVEAGPFTTQFGLLPPSTQQDASSYPNSKTWAAADGVYSVCSFNTVTNPFSAPVPHSVCFVENAVLADLQTINPVTPTRLAWQPWSTAGADHAGNSSILPMDVNGSIFSGLSAESTLQITMRYFLERVPCAKDTTLVTLARTSTPFDPMALELYSRSMNELPVACQAGENPLGEWFTKVMDVVADAFPMAANVAGLVNPPLAAALRVTGAAARIASRVDKAAQKELTDKALAVLKSNAASRANKARGQVAVYPMTRGARRRRR